MSAKSATFVVWERLHVSATGLHLGNTSETPIDCARQAPAFRMKALESAGGACVVKHTCDTPVTGSTSVTENYIADTSTTVPGVTSDSTTTVFLVSHATIREADPTITDWILQKK